MAYKVIQWATGGVGRASLECILDHPELELVGCWVHSTGKQGVDAGVLVGRDPVGVLATCDADALLALEADCVVYSPMVADRDMVLRLLRSGKNLVTPLNWFYPEQDAEQEIVAACRAAGVSLHGSGIHPGGITERFPLMVSALANRVTHVRAEEFSDIRSYGAPDVVGEIMLFGKTPEQAMKSPMVDFMGGGFKQSIRMVADELGFPLDSELLTHHEVAVATAAIESPIGPIQPGCVAAQRFTWQGTVKGEPVVTVITNWLMGEENLDPPWNLGEQGERFEGEVTGDPSATVTFRGWQPEDFKAGLERNPGIVATANHCVNAIPYLCRAAPGIRTYLDLPLIAGRAATIP